ncbi:MAG: intradiol ring-cleavage dioxygenase [Candidatus Acidiferrum sp.]
MPTKKWTRRKFIRSTATTAAALPLAGRVPALRAAPPPACVLNQEQEEGPYYVNREILRGDITEGKIGVPLRLRVTIVAVKTCRPIPNAALDIWHCDASGVYSGYTAFHPGGPGFGGGPGGRRPGTPSASENGGPPPGGPPMGGPGGGPPKHPPTDDKVFLRGVQLSNAEGVVEFTTIYPGHYMGRVNHIHMKVHVGGSASTALSPASGGSAALPEYSGGHVAHSGQMFFPEDISKFVTATHPYADHKVHRTTIEEDMVFNGQNGAAAIASLTPINSTQFSDGYIATLTVAIDPDATPDPADRGLSIPILER